MYCGKCGELLAQNARFCPHCGQKTAYYRRQERLLQEWIAAVEQREPPPAPARQISIDQFMTRVEFRVYSPTTAGHAHLRIKIDRYVAGLTWDDVLFDVRRVKGYLRVAEFQKPYVQTNYYDYTPIYRQRFPLYRTPRDFLNPAVQDDIVATIVELLQQYWKVRVLVHTDNEFEAISAAINRYF